MPLLTDWFLQNYGDDPKYVHEYLLTVPLQVQTITACSKPFQSESLFALCFVYKGALLMSALYEYRVIFTVDGLITPQHNIFKSNKLKADGSLTQRPNF